MSKLRKTFLLVLIFALWNAVWAAPAAAQESDRVVFGRLKTYVHEDNLFAVDYPMNWQKTDLSDPDSNVIVATVSFNDKSALATFLVQVVNSGVQTFDSNEFDAFFKAWVEPQKKSFNKFSAGKPRQLSSDRWSMSFKFERAGTSKTLPVKMKGDVYVQWHGQYLSAITVMMPVSQYSKNQKTLSAMVDSFKLDADGSAGATVTLVEYEHPDGAFTIKHPDGWKAEDLTTDSKEKHIAVALWQPMGNAYIRLDMYAGRGKATIDQITEWAESSTERIFSDYDGYASDEVKEIDKDTVSKKFIYETKTVDGESVSMLGIMVVQRYNGMETYLQIVMPANLESVDTELFQNIMDSLQIDVDVAKELLS